MRTQAKTEIAFAGLCKALGHPVRVRILNELLKRGACQCGEIADQLPLAQSTVSQHLKILREAGLIVGEIQGPTRCYCASPAALERFRNLADSLG